MKRSVVYGILVVTVLVLAALTRTPSPAPASAPGREPMALPEDYRDRFVLYATVERSDAISRNIYINPEALADYTPGDPLPDNTLIVIEAYEGQRDAAGNVLRDAQGHLVQGELDPEIHMAEKRSTWRIEDLAAPTNQGGWNFGAFDFHTGTPITEGLGACASCHDGGL